MLTFGRVLLQNMNYNWHWTNRIDRALRSRLNSFLSIYD